MDPDVFITIVLAALAGAFGIGAALLMRSEVRRDRAGDTQRRERAPHW